MLYKNNHTIPEAMIAFWSDASRSRREVSVYELDKKKHHFSSGLGKRAYSFAVEKDLYVPSISGKRHTGLEQWFARREGTLISLLRQFHADKEVVTFQDEADKTRLIEALLSLECRSVYEVRRVQQLIREQPSLLPSMGAQTDQDPHRAALENVLNFIVEYTLQYSPADVLLCYAPRAASFILVDRPCFTYQLEQQTFRFIVLTPRVLALYRKSDSVLRFGRHEVDADFVDQANQYLAASARKWLVGTSRDSLQPYIDLTERSEYRQAVAREFAKPLPVEHLPVEWQHETFKSSQKTS